MLQLLEAILVREEPLFKLVIFFYWSSLRKDVDSFVSQCDGASKTNMKTSLTWGYCSHYLFQRLLGRILRWISQRACHLPMVYCYMGGYRQTMAI